MTFYILGVKFLRECSDIRIEKDFYTFLGKWSCIYFIKEEENMSVGSVSNTQSTDAYSYASTNKTQVKTEAQNAAAETGVVYEKSAETGKKATYSINKMSEKERADLVTKLKADQANRQSQLVSIVEQMMTKQSTTFSLANGSDDMWKFLASGNFEVDAATKAQAQEDISEDGYWGVKQTSQRLFDFASALAGDDVEKMKEMQAAMEKGFKLATKAWGKDLPDISKNTLDAANQLFEDYYKSKETGVEA